MRWEPGLWTNPYHLEFEDGFGTSAANPTPGVPVMTIRVTLTGRATRGTRMDIKTAFSSPEAMEQIISTGIEEVMTAAIGQIDAVLASWPQASGPSPLSVGSSRGDDRPQAVVERSGCGMLRRRGFWLAVGTALALSAACGAPSVTSTEVARRLSTSTSTSTLSTAAPAPRTLSMVPRPEGATVPGAFEWYRGPAPDGHEVTLGVFRPPGATRIEPSITVIVLPGGDGLRRIYEELAQRLAGAGFISVLGSWYEHDESSCPVDAIHCPNAPVWKGMNAAAVRDVDAVVAAVGHVPGVDPNRVVLFGHSYGGGVALLRAASGSTERVVSSAGLNSRTGYRGTPLPTDEFPSDVASSIRAPVLVIQGRYDGITPFEMAEALIRAMPADNPADSIFYPAPANHGYLWQPEAFSDRPGVPMSVRVIEDVTSWIRAQFAS